MNGRRSLLTKVFNVILPLADTTLCFLNGKKKGGIHEAPSIIFPVPAFYLELMLASDSSIKHMWKVCEDTDSQRTIMAPAFGPAILLSVLNPIRWCQF